MGRRRSRFTQTEVARALRAAQQVGGFSVSISPDGTISLQPIVVSPVTVEPRKRTPNAEQPPAIVSGARRQLSAKHERAIWITSRAIELRGETPALMECRKAEADYEKLRQSLIRERREAARPGVKSPPLGDHPKLTEAYIGLQAKMKADEEELQVFWNEAAREYDRLNSKL